MRKILSAVIACTLAASMLTTPAFALSENHDTVSKLIEKSGYSDDIEVMTEDGYEYSIINDKVVIRGYAGEDTFLNIPKKLGGQKVSVIGDYAFDHTNITGFSLPYDVKEIGKGAFEGCQKLESANITSVNTIGEGAFYDCISLKEITLSSYLQEIPKEMFYNCVELAEVKSNIETEGFHTKTISDRAFFCCKKLSSIQNIVNEAESIGYGAFSGCDSLVDVYLWSDLETLGSRAFALCDNLESIELPKTITTYGYEIFDTCPKLKAAIIPEGAVVIRNGAYKFDESITEISIPDTVETIEDYAFKGCTSLGWVTIPDSVTEIGKRAFDDCPNVVICGSADSAAYKFAADNSLPFIDTSSIPYNYEVTLRVTSDGTEKEYPIEYDIDRGGFAADYIPSLKDMVMLNYNNKLSHYGSANGGGYGFNVKDDGVRDGIKGIIFFLTEETVTDEDGDPRVQAKVKYEWLKNDTDTDTATDTADTTADTETDTAADTDTVDTETDTATDTNTDSEYTSGDYSYAILEDGTISITKYTGKDENLVIPSEIDGKTVTSLGVTSFMMNPSIKTVSIPDTVTVIDTYAFSYCMNLTSVTIPDSVVTISDGAFQYCSKLDNVVVPDSVKSMGVRAFGDDTALTKIELSDNNTTFADCVLDGCTSLKDIYFTGSEDEFNNSGISDLDRKIITDNNVTVHFNSHMPADTLDPSGFTYESNADLDDGSIKITGYHGSAGNVIIPSEINGKKVSRIDNYAFENNASITNVTIPVTVTEIGISAFKGCSSLAEVTIPESLTKLEKYAFEDCSSLEEVILPEGITNIEPYTFSMCTSLKTAVIPDSVTDIDSNAFYGCDNVTISCNSGSFAEQFAKEYGIPYVTSGSNVNPTGILGDVNGDNKVTAKDSMQIQRYAVKLISLDEDQLKLADVDGDNKVGNKDALNILRYTIHANVKYPIGTDV